MSRLASVRFRDGELPEVMDVVRLVTILFAAGQETTARLFSAGMRFLCEQPAVVEELRSDPGAIPNFIEECMRLAESAVRRHAAPSAEGQVVEVATADSREDDGFPQ
jgi:cytochrome P450